MVANNLIEIYTLIFAWNMYGAIWDVLTGTGLALIPFIVMIFLTFKEGFERGTDAKSIVRAAEIRLISLILILMLCVLPFKGWGVQLATVRYDVAVNDCNPPSNLQGAGNSTGTGADALIGTTLSKDNAGNALVIYRPIAWSLVELVSTALTNTTIKSMQCVNNYDFLLVRIGNTKVINPQLRDRLSNFYEQCYKTANSLFVANPPEPFPVNPSEVQKTDWMGSHLLMKTPGDYMNHPGAFMPNMDGFGFTRSIVNRATDRQTATGANPSCWEVWNGEQGLGLVNPAVGLRQQILDEVPLFTINGDLLNDFLNWGWMLFGPNAMQEVEKEDLLIKLIIQADNANLATQTDLDLTGILDADKTWQKRVSDVGLGLGGLVFTFDDVLQASTVRQGMKTAGPIILALIQMLIIFASPIVMTLGGFRFTTFVAIAVTYFGMEFINAIWAAAFFLDNNLLVFYYSEGGAHNRLVLPIMNATTAASSIFLPIIWLSLLAYSGTGILKGIGAMGVGGGLAFGSSAKTPKIGGKHNGGDGKKNVATNPSEYD